MYDIKTIEKTLDLLDKTHELAGDSGMVIHSDRGFHYRIPAWTDRMEKYGYVRSMSKKGCSPDNSACEGFFGTMKNEFYYPNDWASGAPMSSSRNWKNTLFGSATSKLKQGLETQI